LTHKTKKYGGLSKQSMEMLMLKFY